MPAGQGHEIVITGAGSRLGKLVRGKLDDAKWTCAAVSRRDDPREPMEGAGVVLVLDALNDRSPGAGLRDVRRIASAILDVTGAQPNPPHVIVLAYWPSGPDRAVARLREGGVPVTCVKPSLVVGTLTDPGPSDAALRPRRGRPWVPNGTREWAPILIDDLALMLANAATTHRPAEGTALVGGAAPMTADKVVEELGGHPRKFPVWLYRFLPGADPYLAAPDTLPAAESMAGRTHFAVRPRALADEWGGSGAGVRTGRFRAASRYGRTPAMLGTALLLILFGLFLLAAGGHDVVAVADIGRGIAGVVMAASGASVLGSGLLLVAGGWPLRFSAAGWACVVVGAWCVVFTALSHRAGGNYQLVGVWAVLIILSLLGAYTMHRRGDIRQMLHGLPAVLTSLLVGGAVLGTVQFWYLDLYRPATAPPSLNLTPSLKVAKARGSEPRMVTAKLRLENKGAGSVNVVGSMYVILGREWEERRPPTSLAERQQALNDALDGGQSLSNYEWLADTHLIEAGDIVDKRSEMHPGQVFTSAWQLAVPADRFDDVTLVTYLITARRRLVFSPLLLDPKLGESGHTAEYEFDLEEDSFVRQLIRRQHRVHLEQHYSALGSTEGCRVFPHMTAYIDRKGRTANHPAGCDDYLRRLGGHYGLYGISNASSVAIP